MRASIFTFASGLKRYSRCPHDMTNTHNSGRNTRMGLQGFLLDNSTYDLADQCSPYDLHFWVGYMQRIWHGKLPDVMAGVVHIISLALFVGISLNKTVAAWPRVQHAGLLKILARVYLARGMPFLRPT